jgi:hypothetical protein
VENGGRKHKYPVRGCDALDEKRKEERGFLLSARALLSKCKIWINRINLIFIVLDHRISVFGIFVVHSNKPEVHFTVPEVQCTVPEVQCTVPEVHHKSARQPPDHCVFVSRITPECADRRDLGENGTRRLRGTK